jgi:hypothetical protein
LKLSFAAPIDYERDDRATVAVFSSVAATVIAALYFGGRIGFDNPLQPIVATLGLSLFVSVTPFIVWRLLPRPHYDEAEAWWRSQTFLTIVAIGITALSGMAVPLTGWNGVWTIAAIGYVSALATLVLWMLRGKILRALVFIAGAAMFATWACGVAWSTRYKNPVFWETVEYRADVHHDPLYYVSMANSMRSYGVPSTALDGVPYTPYHYGSAWLNSQWAYLADRDVLEFYSLGVTVVGIPLFFCAVLLLAVEVRKGPTGKRRLLRDDYVAWLIFLAATIGVIPSSGLDAMGIWNRHAMISESYVAGLPVFLLIISTTMVFWRRRKTSYRFSDILFLFVFAPAMLMVAGILKVSTMLLLLAAALGLVVLGRLYRDKVISFATVLSIAVSAVAYKLVSVAAQNQGIVPFAYMRYYANPAWWPYFVLVHLFWSWLYIYLRLREEDVKTVGDVRQAALQGRITDVVVVAIVAIAGWAAGELIDIHGGSAVYFSDVQRWLSLALLVGALPRWLAQRSEVGSQRSFSVGGIRVSRMWLVAIAIPISITIILNTIRMPATALRANIALRRAFYSQAGANSSVGVRSLADPGILSRGLKKSPDYELISTLRGLDRMPPTQKARTAVFIPQSFTGFWRIWPEPERCSFVPLIVPATSGLVLIDGMPPVDCDLTVQYGMTMYKRRTAPQQAADVTPPALCAKAKAKGFSRIVVVEGTDPAHVSWHGIDCARLSSTP